MNLANIDLNLLVAFDVLLREKNVTRAANQLNITQPAMSNSLKRLRTLLNDPVLVRTSEGMVATERANQLAPSIKTILRELKEALQEPEDFDALSSDRVFRIMAGGYAASTLLPKLLDEINVVAPGITLDIMTPSDVSFHDVEDGKIDMAINYFDDLPQSFHQKVLWKDGFSCLTNKDNPAIDDFNLQRYLDSKHVWVSKTGFGVGLGINPKDVQKLGWIDTALAELDERRNIKIFTRDYNVAMQLTRNQNIIATLPKKVAQIKKDSSQYVILDAPFAIPEIELKMIWSPLLHHEASHIWFRKLVTEVARTC